VESVEGLDAEVLDVDEAGASEKFEEKREFCPNKMTAADSGSIEIS
jgi:hypothetical protein